jgi:hypothetical protein
MIVIATCGKQHLWLRQVQVSPTYEKVLDITSFEVPQQIYNSATKMSYDLFNPSTEICRKFSKQHWAKALELARMYGWQPMGTLSPSEHNFYEIGADWSGTYLTNDGQMVKAEDAYSLAAALEKALDDIPDDKVKIDWSSKFWEDDLPEWLSPEEKEMIAEELEDGLLDLIGVHPLQYFAGDEKYYLTRFIKFCRLGSFIVL